MPNISTPSLYTPKTRRIIFAANLLLKKNRKLESLCLIEGPNSIEWSMKRGLLVEVFISDSKKNNFEKEIQYYSEKNIIYNFITDEAEKKLSDTVTPSGIFAVSKLPKFNEINTTKTDVLLHNISDPGNLGTIIRLCSGFLVDNLYIVGNCVDEFNPKVLRSSAGAIFTQSITHFDSIEEAFEYLRKDNKTLIAKSGYSKKDVEDLIINDSTDIVWVFGEEANGLDEKTLDLVDSTVKIPMSENIESYNLATAVAICIYHSYKRKNEK